MFPMLFPYQQSTNSSMPQKSFKEQIQDAEDLIKFIKDKSGGGDKKETKLKDTKFSLWETGLILAVVSFTCAIPIVIWQANSLLLLKQSLDLIIR